LRCVQICASWTCLIWSYC